MSKKNFLTKVMAGVALGAAALLASAPSATIASDWGYGGFDKKFGHHEKFKETGFISGTVVLDSTGDAAQLFVYQVCSKPQANPFAKIIFNGEDAETFLLPLELQFPGLDLIFQELFLLDKKFDHKKFDHKFDDDKFDHYGKFDHGKKFDHKKFDDKKDGIFFVYEGSATITDVDILDLIAEGETFVVKGSCAVGSLEVILLADALNGDVVNG